MSSLFGVLFSCCLRPKGQASDRTPLLGDGETPVYVPRDAVSVHRQKVKDRLSSIVRAKESKMVNISDHLPFNLQNRDLPTPSSSRVRAESPSPHPSVRTAETRTTSHSRDSSRPGGSRLGVPKEPALSVRLVRGREGSNRGACRGRLGRFGEERGFEIIRDSRINGTMESSNPDRNVPNVRIIEPEANTAPLVEDEHTANVVTSLPEEQLREGWKIQDAGPISRGWGD